MSWSHYKAKAPAGPQSYRTHGELLPSSAQPPAAPASCDKSVEGASSRLVHGDGGWIAAGSPSSPTVSSFICISTTHLFFFPLHFQGLCPLKTKLKDLAFFRKLLHSLSHLLKLKTHTGLPQTCF